MLWSVSISLTAYMQMTGAVRDFGRGSRCDNASSLCISQNHSCQCRAFCGVSWVERWMSWIGVAAVIFWSSCPSDSPTLPCSQLRFRLSQTRYILTMIHHWGRRLRSKPAPAYSTVGRSQKGATTKPSPANQCGPNPSDTEQNDESGIRTHASKDQNLNLAP